MKMIVATRNEHKLKEFKRILEPLGYEVISQQEVCPDVEVEEDGDTFAENARKKALEIYRRTGMPSIADDSGLCVDALDGEPGVYSARYAGEQHNDANNNHKLIRNMSHVPREMRGAHFACAICCVLGEDDIINCEGRCNGMIGYKPLGDNGFGYDPLFMVGDRSFAELSAEEKDEVSHRGVALRVFEKEMKKRYSVKGVNKC